MPHFPKPFYRKPRRRWYVEIHGKQINLGPDRVEAFQKYHELMASPEAPVLPSPELTEQFFAPLCDRFLEWVQIHRARPTYEGYLYRLQRFVDRYPELTIEELRPFHVQEWADAHDISVTTRRNYMRSVKTCLRWCCKQGYIQKSPLEHMDIPAADRKDVYVSPEEFQRILEHVKDPNLRDLFITTYEIGCRPQESLRVERRHVELEHQRWVFPSSESKGKSTPRIVYLTDKVMEITSPADAPASDRAAVSQQPRQSLDRRHGQLGRGPDSALHGPSGNGAPRRSDFGGRDRTSRQNPQPHGTGERENREAAPLETARAGPGGSSSRSAPRNSCLAIPFTPSGTRGLPTPSSAASTP